MKELKSDALKLLRKHYRKLNPLDVLNILPTRMVMEDIQEYIISLFRHHGNTMNSYKVQENLFMMRKIQTQETLLKLKARSVIVDDRSRCKVCNKKILANQMIACYPDLQVVHYSCCDDVKFT